MLKYYRVNNIALLLIILLRTHSPHYVPKRAYPVALVVGRYPSFIIMTLDLPNKPP